MSKQNTCVNNISFQVLEDRTKLMGFDSVAARVLSEPAR